MAEPAYLTETFVPKPEKITGGILYAPAGTVVPTNAKDKLNAAFTELGYVSADGVKISKDSSDDGVDAWGGVEIRKIRTKFSESLSFKLYSTVSPDVLKAVLGADNVIVNGTDITVKHNADIAPLQTFVINTIDPATKVRKRYVIPEGQILVTGDTTISHSEMTALEVEVGAKADATGTGIYELIDVSGLSARPAAAVVVAAG